MLVGINYPWIDCGWDFGDPPPAWVASESVAAWRENKRKQIEEDFRLFAAQGIRAVRWFIMADGLNYGMGALAPRKASNGWTFNPLPAENSFYSRFVNDFEFALQVCRNNNLKLFPSLIDSSWCWQGNPVADNSGIIKGGRYDVVRDPEKRQEFFDWILDPLLELSMRYLDSIYAWELINEPEWVVRNFWPWWKKDRDRMVSRKEMKAFIAEGIHRINAKRLPDGSSAFPSSVGFAHWKSLDEWDAGKLGITLHQFHYYAQQNCELPKCADAVDPPCIVGEFATAAGKDWPDLLVRGSGQTTTNRLLCIENKGYPACFLWSAKAVDPATRWTEEEHREVVAYTGSKQANSFKV
jgi:hypothetical protein